MSHLNKKVKYRTFLFLAYGLLILSVFFSSTVGIADIGMFEALKIMVAGIPGMSALFQGNSVDHTHTMIILDIRMPRILLSASIGAILAVVGGSFQGLFRNPMADPYVLGISNGAGLGATLAIVLGLEGLSFGVGLISLSAFAGALLTTILVYMIASVGGRLPSVNLLLSGIAVGLFEYSIITVLMVFKRDKIENIIMWLMGSVNAATWGQVAMLVPLAVIGTLSLCFFARDLNAIAAGEDTAKSLGIKVETVKKILLGLCSLLIAISVSVSGIIGFVGLVVPHTARMIVGPDHRFMLPFSAVGGAIFLVICDTLARTVMPPMELPVGAVTSLFGAPFFIYLLVMSKKKVSL